MSSISYSDHWMGGEITWVCQGGGDYVFTLKIHRDCNGPPVNLGIQRINVWNHPTLNQITLNYSLKNEISPTCKEVLGGPSSINCSSNIVLGAAEEYVFISAPINIIGIPPNQGWVFTWHNQTRNMGVVNLLSPSTQGITLRAVMYGFGGSNGSPCFDSSPQFIESPSSVICAGNEFVYSPNAYDPDNDSLVFSFGQPLDAIQTSYNPPSDPIALQWSSGYGVLNPLPGTTQNANNIPASIVSKNGELHFKSNTVGSFALVVKVQSFRCGSLISEVYREMQVVIIPCGVNSPPAVQAPLNGNTTFYDTVVAGSTVFFDINALDNDLLQDNTNQTIELTASGSQFGLNYIDALNGCDSPPCATLSFTPPLYGVGNVGTSFQWQTTCDHLNKKSFSGCIPSANNTYNFVFKVKDDFCPVPSTKYYTVSITVVPPDVLPPPIVKCVNTLASGDVRIVWESIIDTIDAFQEYEVFSSTGGSPFSSVGTITNINANSFLHFGADAQNNKYDYIVATKSACGILNYTDTISSMKLRVSNPGTGEAVLQWNPIFKPVNSPTSSNFYFIYKEYPLGTWLLVDSAEYGNEYYRDTITVCDDSVNYKISITNDVCVSFSSIDGDNFKDLLPPNSPTIKNVSVDASSGYAKVCWSKTSPNDVEGYIILRLIGTTWQPVDTVYVSSGDLCYIDSNSNPNFTSECYGIAAFDSCWYGSPLSPNTSGMGVSHCSVFLESNYNVCEKSIELNWNKYTDWSSNVKEYLVYYSINGGTNVLGGIVSNNVTSYTLSGFVPNSNYCFVVKAVSGNEIDTASSNVNCVYTSYPNVSDTNYLQVATIDNPSKITIRIYAAKSTSTSGYNIKRSEDGISFSYIGFAPYSLSPITFNDNNVEADKSYYYKAVAIDSCGFVSDSITNIGKTILLNVSSNSTAFVNNMTWDSYLNWDGGTNFYEIYRKIGVSNYALIGNVPFGTNSFSDDVSAFFNVDSKGTFCYKIKAVENINSYGISEESFSNESCAGIDYLLYVPNAFTPLGVNPIFKPVIGFANFDSYSLTIYNRIYKEVFFTNDIEEGWDGTFNGKKLQEGIYVYFIQFNDSEGKPFQKVGHVMMIKP